MRKTRVAPRTFNMQKSILMKMFGIATIRFAVLKRSKLMSSKNDLWHERLTKRLSSIVGEIKHMPPENSSNQNRTNFIYMVFRIDPDLKPYIPIINVGFTFLLNTWEFPDVPKDRAKHTRVPLTETDREALQYLMKHSGKSGQFVVGAALIRAQSSKVRPIKTALRQIAAAEAHERGEEL